MALRALSRGFRWRVLSRGFAVSALEEHRFQEQLRENQRLHSEDFSLLAQSHSNLIRLYRDMNKPALVLAHTQQQFALLQRAQPAPAKDLAEVARSLVEQLYGEHRYQECEGLARQCLAYSLQTYAANSVEVAKAHFLVAHLCEILGKFDEAAQLCLATAEILRSLSEIDFLATVYQTLANVKKSQQQFSEAQTYISTSLSLLEESKSESKADIQASAWSVQGEIYCLLGKFPEAEEFHRRALESRRAAKSDAEVSTCLSNLGMLQLTVGKLDEAEVLFKEKLELDRRVFTEVHPSTANSYHNLSAVAEAKNDLQAAKAHALKALSIRAQTLGSNHPHIALAHQNLVAICLGLKQLDEAEQHAKLAADVGAQTYSPTHPFLGTALFDLGVVASLREKYADAKQYFQKALTLRQGIYPATHPTIGSTYLALAQACKRTADLANAGECYSKGYEIMKEVLPPDHPDLATILNNRGSVSFARQQFAEAETDIQASLDLRRKQQAEDSPVVITTRGNLAAVLLAAKKYPAAEAELRKCLQTVEKQPLPGVTSKEVGKLLVKALEGQNKTKEAAALAKRLDLPS